MTSGKLLPTLGSLYREAKAQLEKALGPDGDGGLEAGLLLEAAGIPRTRLLRDGGLPPPDGVREKLAELLSRRISGEPIQYILGEWEFFGLPFQVGPGVLIPRPETEMLVELALEFSQALPAPSLLDLCSGSGCIPIAFGKSCPGARVAGVELSPKALSWFRKNIALNAVPNVTAVEGDAKDPPAFVRARQWDIITSNPPYIPASQLPSLQREVLMEPRMALDGGADGLDFYRILPAVCRDLLTPGGLLLLEIGEDQGSSVPALLEQAGYRDVSLRRDLSGHARVVSGRL